MHPPPSPISPHSPISPTLPPPPAKTVPVIHTNIIQNPNAAAQTKINESGRRCSRSGLPRSGFLISTSYGHRHHGSVWPPSHLLPPLNKNLHSYAEQRNKETCRSPPFPPSLPFHPTFTSPSPQTQRRNICCYFSYTTYALGDISPNSVPKTGHPAHFGSSKSNCPLSTLLHFLSGGESRADGLWL